MGRRWLVNRKWMAYAFMSSHVPAPWREDAIHLCGLQRDNYSHDLGTLS